MNVGVDDRSSREDTGDTVSHAKPFLETPHMKTIAWLPVLLLSSMPALTADVRSGLVLHYGFNAPGAVAPDESGHGCDGAIVGARPEASGVRGACLRFDGVGAFVRPARNPTTNGQYSVSLWFKPDATEPAALASRNMIAMNRRYQIGFEANGPHLRFYSFCLNANSYGYGALRASSGIFDLQPFSWNHVVMIVDGGAGFYLNGRPLGYISGPGANRGSLELLIGAMNNDPAAGPRYFFPGLIDEVRIYDRALTDEEIAELFRADAPKTLLPSAPVALGPSYIVKDGRFHLRTQKDGRTEERALGDAETAALLAGAGVKTGDGSATQPESSVCQIGFSNDPRGEQDVTVFLPDESLHVRIRDADYAAADTNVIIRVFLSQRGGETADADTKSALVQLARSRGGLFTGNVPLQSFRPGPVWVSVVATESGGQQPLLVRSSRIDIVQPKAATPP